MSTRDPTTAYGDLFSVYPPSVILEDGTQHLPPYYFCTTGDPTCPCHDDPILITHVHAEVMAGLLTPEEATRIVQGTQINIRGGRA